MRRHCDGTDPNLLQPVVDQRAALAEGQPGYRPCACGLRFDDVQRLVIWPHQRLLTAAERAALVDQLARLFDVPAHLLAPGGPGEGSGTAPVVE